MTRPRDCASYVRASNAADALRVSRDTVLRWVKAGDVRAIRHGRSGRVMYVHYDDALARCYRRRRR